MMIHTKYNLPHVHSWRLLNFREFGPPPSPLSVPDSRNLPSFGQKLADPLPPSQSRRHLCIAPYIDVQPKFCLWCRGVFRSLPKAFWHQLQKSNFFWEVCAVGCGCPTQSVLTIVWKWSAHISEQHVLTQIWIQIVIGNLNEWDLNLACIEVAATFVQYGVFQAAILWRK